MKVEGQFFKREIYKAFNIGMILCCVFYLGLILLTWIKIPHNEIQPGNIVFIAVSLLS